MTKFTEKSVANFPLEIPKMATRIIKTNERDTPLEVSLSLSVVCTMMKFTC